MAEFRSEFLHELMGENKNFSEDEFRTKLREYLKEENRETAPVETAPAPSASIGMFMPPSAPMLQGRKNLALFLERFYKWASVTGCNSALDSDVPIKLPESRAQSSRDFNIARWHTSRCKSGNLFQRR